MERVQVKSMPAHSFSFDLTSPKCTNNAIRAALLKPRLEGKLSGDDRVKFNAHRIECIACERVLRNWHAFNTSLQMYQGANKIHLIRR